MAHGLPVAFFLIIVILFNGVSQGVPEIQKHPLAGVKLVSLHYLPLDINAAGDDRGKFRLKIRK